MNEKNLDKTEYQESKFTFTLQHPAGQCFRANEIIQVTEKAANERKAAVLAENNHVCDICTARYRLL